MHRITQFSPGTRKRSEAPSVSFHDRSYSPVEVSSLLSELAETDRYPLEVKLLDATIDFLNFASACTDANSAKNEIEKMRKMLEMAYANRASLLPGAFSYCAKYIKQQMSMTCQFQQPFARFYNEYDGLQLFLLSDWDDADKTPAPSPSKK